MGPVLICDKSTLQSLARDELNALRRYYSLNVPPVLVMEILGDLKKENQIAVGQKEVRVLADKILPASSTVHTDFRTLIRGEISGHPFPLDGRPVLTGGKQLASPEGKKGVLFEEPAEAKALLRWQAGEFSATEELLAEKWRAATQSIDLEAMQRKLRGEYSTHLKLRSFEQTVEFVNDLMSSASQELMLEWFALDSGISLPRSKHEVSSEPITTNFPFTAYCIRVSLIFHFGLAFGLISTRPTNRIDLEYLFYLPFCTTFSSGDALHRDLAPLVRDAVIFIARDDLKTDLKEIAQLDRDYPNQVPGPPQRAGSPTCRAWGMVAQLPAGVKKGRLDLSSEVSAKMLKHFKSFLHDGKPPNEPFSGSQEELDFMVMQHSVRPNGPCICGGEKRFIDCCGRNLKL